MIKQILGNKKGDGIGGILTFMICLPIIAWILATFVSGYIYFAKEYYVRSVVKTTVKSACRAGEMTLGIYNSGIAEISRVGDFDVITRVTRYNRASDSFEVIHTQTNGVGDVVGTDLENSDVISMLVVDRNEDTYSLVSKRGMYGNTAGATYALNVTVRYEDMVSK